MKVPPKRKGNRFAAATAAKGKTSLNESPSEKEGKLEPLKARRAFEKAPSMKVPPKRKGNS